MAKFNSYDELENDKSKWTLDSDQKLLNTLQSTSEQTLKTIQSLCDRFQASEDAVAKSAIKVDNLMTSVLLLSNSKFVENRVYDEDIDEIQKSNPPAFVPNSAKKNAESAKIEAEKVFIDNLKSSIVNGSKQLQDKLGLLDTDIQSLDKINLVNNLYRQNDSFSKIPLPYLIGSDEFIKATFVGLKSSPDNSPIRLSDNKHSTVFDYNHTPEPSNSHNHNHQQQSRDNDYAEDDDEEFFQQSPQKVIPKPQKPPSNLFSSTADDDDDDDDDLFTKSIVPSRESSVPKTVPKDLPEVVPNGEEDALPDIMSQLTAQMKNKFAQQPPNKLPSLSTSSSRSSLDKVGQQKNAFPSPTANFGNASRPPPKSIFDSDQDDDDDDLFSAKATKPLKKPMMDNKSVESSQSDSIYSNASTPATGSNVDVRSKSSNSSNSTLSSDVAATKGRMKSIFDDDDDDDDNIFGDKLSKAKTVKKPPAAVQKNLFGSDDDEGDDLFDNKASSKSNTPANSSKKFIDELNSKLAPKITQILPELPKEVPKQAPKAVVSKALPKSLFDDDDDDDDLFSGKKNVMKKPVESVPKVTQSQPEVPKEVPKQAPKASVPKALPKSLFDDDDGDNDLFSGKNSMKKPVESVPKVTQNQPEVPKEVPKQAPKALPKSLFDDDDGDNDLFMVKKPVESVKKNVEVHETKSPSKTKTPLLAPNVINELSNKLANKLTLEDSQTVSPKVVPEESKKDEAQIPTPTNLLSNIANPPQDEHFNILKSKSKVNSTRRRKPPTRGHIARMSSQNSSQDSQEEASEVEKPSTDSVDSKTEPPKPVVLEVDIEVSVPKAPIPNPLSNDHESLKTSIEVISEPEVVPEPVKNILSLPVIENPLMFVQNVEEIVQNSEPEVVPKVNHDIPKPEPTVLPKVNNNIPKSATKKSLFDSDDSDSDLFGGPPKKSLPVSGSSTTSNSKQSNISTKQPSLPVKKPVISASLFGDDSDDEEKIVSTTVFQAGRRKAANKSIFDDDSDTDLFKS